MQQIPDLIYRGLGNFTFIICEYIDAEVKFIDWLVEYHEEIDNVCFNRMYASHGYKIRNYEDKTCNCKFEEGKFFFS